MSRSKLKSKYMRSLYKGISPIAARRDGHIRNPHRQDEMPKNRPSRFITTHCSSACVDWLQDSTSFGGHSRPKGGRRRVSGLVRARLRSETRRLILEQLQEDGKKKGYPKNMVGLLLSLKGEF